MSFGECDPKAVRPTVRIAVQVAGRALQRLERLWEGPERPFVRGELDNAFEAELSLNLFDRLARLVGDDPCERGPEEAGGNLRHYEPGVVSSDFLRQNQSAPPAAASIDAIAPLFNPACSPVPGTAARALRFPNFFANFHTPQPSTAFRRLMIPMGLLSRKRAYQPPFPNRGRAHSRERTWGYFCFPCRPRFGAGRSPIGPGSRRRFGLSFAFWCTRAPAEWARLDCAAPLPWFARPCVLAFFAFFTLSVLAAWPCFPDPAAGKTREGPRGERAASRGAATRPTAFCAAAAAAGFCVFHRTWCTPS